MLSCVNVMLASTLKIAQQCESVDHQMSHLSVSEVSEEDTNRFAKNQNDLMVAKTKRKKEFIATIVGQVGTWVDIKMSC